MPTPAEIQALVDQLPVDIGRANLIVNGPESGEGSEVMTGSGPVRTLARVIKDIWDAGADSLAALAAAAGLIDSTVAAGQAAVAATGAVWVANVANAGAADYYANAAAGVAAVADGSFFKVIEGGNVVVYRDVAGVAVAQVTLPGLGSLERSNYTLPTGYVEGYVDQYERLGARMKADGTWVLPAIELTAGGTIEGVDKDTFNLIIQKGLAGIFFEGPVNIKQKTLFCFSQDGQSDSEGADSMNALSTVARLGLLMFEAVRVRFVAAITRFTTGLRPMVEENYVDGLGNQWGETPVYGTGNSFINRLTRDNKADPVKYDYNVLGWSTGVSSTGLAANNKGGSNGSWTMLMAAGDAAVAAAAARGETPIYIGDCLRVAATDYDLGTTKAAYRALLETRRTDLYNDMRPKFSQTRRPLIIIVQDHHHPSRGSPNDPKLAEAQYEFAQAYPDDVYIAGPQYAMLYEFGGSHHSNRESRITGEWQGVCMKRAWIDRSWDNFDVKTVVAVEPDLLEITYADLAYTQLVFDCKEIGQNPPASVGAQPRYGFDPLDNAGGALAIVGQPWIYGTHKVRIRLAAPLTNSGETLAYGRGTYGGNLKRVPSNALLNYAVTINAVSEPIEQWALVTPRIPIQQ